MQEEMKKIKLKPVEKKPEENKNLITSKEKSFLQDALKAALDLRRNYFHPSDEEDDVAVDEDDSF